MLLQYVRQPIDSPPCCYNTIFAYISCKYRKISIPVILSCCTWACNFACALCSRGKQYQLGVFAFNELSQTKRAEVNQQKKATRRKNTEKWIIKLGFIYTFYCRYMAVALVGYFEYFWLNQRKSKPRDLQTLRADCCYNCRHKFAHSLLPAKHVDWFRV